MNWCGMCKQQDNTTGCSWAIYKGKWGKKKKKKVLACSKKRDSPGGSVAIKRDMVSILHEIEEQGRTTSGQQGVRTHDKL